MVLNNVETALKRAALIIQYRNLTVDREEKEEGVTKYFLSKGEKKIVLLCLIDQKTIGIAFVRELKELIDSVGAEKGIIVGVGKYTYSAKSSAPKLGIELIPPTLPPFDIFQHELVPKCEIITKEEKKRLTDAYHAHPYQFPWILNSDPVSIILGAVPGDIIKVNAKSETAGHSVSYRYVV